MNVRQAKNFITWARKNKIAKIKIGDLEVEFSNFAFAEEYKDLEDKVVKITQDIESPDEYDKTLFAST